jgi:hypothetical protein
LVSNTEPVAPQFEAFYQRIYKYKFLIPLFPKWSQDWDRFWYRDSLMIIMLFSGMFYLLALFFVYLAIFDRAYFMSYLITMVGWVLVGLIVPSGLYRLTVLFLKSKHLVQ